MADKEIEVYKKIVWQLHGMTEAKIEAYKVGEKLESASTKIVVGDNITEWNLLVYLDGDREKYKDSISLYLCLKNADSRNFETNFILGIVGKNGNKEVQCEWPAEFFNTGYGTGAFLKRDELVNLDRGSLVDGKITFYCNLTITAKEDAKSSKTDLLKQNILGNFKRMMDEEVFADFDIETTEKDNDKKVLKAHKCVLGVSSTFFFGLLTTKMKENESNVVKVTEDYIIMKEVLRFIYTGDEAENLSAIANELVFAAEKYQLDGLKELCLANIIKTLNTKNALQALLAADRLTNSETLKAKCIQMIARNFKSLKTTTDWKKLSPGLLTEIMSEIVDDKDTIYV